MSAFDFLNLILFSYLCVLIVQELNQTNNIKFNSNAK